MLLFIFSALASYVPCTRRGVIGASLMLAARDDPYASSSSLFNIAPPPLAGTWSEIELLAQARAGNVKSVQIAPQHDTIFSVDVRGRRHTTAMRDEDFESFVLDATPADGAIPFTVLPIDERRAALRDFTGKFALTTALTWGIVRALSL